MLALSSFLCFVEYMMETKEKKKLETFYDELKLNFILSVKLGCFYINSASNLTIIHQNESREGIN